MRFFNLKIIARLITFSSEKVLDLWKMKVKFVRHFWPTVLVLSIKNGFNKIKKSIFRPNYARYEKILRSKIVHLKKIYKFDSDHFLKKHTVFILIKNTLLKIKSCSYRPNNASYEKMLPRKIVHLKEIYNFDFNHFLIKPTVFVLIMKNFIKNQKFNFPDKLCNIWNKC